MPRKKAAASLPLIEEVSIDELPEVKFMQPTEAQLLQKRVEALEKKNELLQKKMISRGD